MGQHAAAWVGLLCCGWVTTQAAEPPSTATALAQLAAAFESGQTEPIRAMASSAARVRVDIQGSPPVTGSYGPGQLAAVFARIFANCETRSFAYVKDSQRTSGSSAFARATWVKRIRGDPRDVEQSLTFAFALERGSWRLVEIRATR